MRLPFRCAANVPVLLRFLLFTPAYAGVAQSAEVEISPQELIGKKIYYSGSAREKGDITARLTNSDAVIPAMHLACANCHGISGDGITEAGVRAPSITWQTLSRTAAPAGSARSRGAYNDASLEQAITHGIDSSGSLLHPGMPRYQISEAQAAAVIAYLKILGTSKDTDPGIGDTTIRLGTLLPQSGPFAAISADIEAVLRAYFTQINNAGGIYGRRIELIVEDTGGKPDGVHAATRRLIESHRVFAMVASFDPGFSGSRHDALERSTVPVIGPVMLTPHVATTPNRFVYYLLPSFYDQARSLVDYISNSRVNPAQRLRLAVIHAEGDYEEAAAVGALAQGKLHGLEIIIDQRYVTGQFPARAMYDLLAAKQPDYILFFGPGQDLEALAKHMAQGELNIPVATSTAMVGRAAFNMRSRFTQQLLLVHPAALPGKDDFSELAILLGGPGNNPVFQALALGAAKIFVETAKRSGRRLNRAILVNTIEQLRDFKTGVAPPVSFGPGHHIGARSSYIVRIDTVSGQYIALTERLEPQ